MRHIIPVAKRGSAAPRAVGWLLVAWVLSACAPVRPPGPLPAEPSIAPFEAAFVVPAGAEPLPIDARASLVRILVYRGGRLAHLGHNHVIAARRVEGSVYRHADEWFADLRLPVQGFTVDEPDLRQAAGEGFARPLTEEAVAATRENMLSARVLDAARFPVIRARGTFARGEARARLRLGVRGRELTVSAPVAVDEAPGQFVATGRLQLDHAELGLEPFSALGGALRVAETLEIDYRLVAVVD